MENQNTPVLETTRLLLRKFTQSDFGALLAIYGDTVVNTFLPWFPLKTLADARRFYEERYAKCYKQARGYRYAICLKTNHVPIGYVNIGMEPNHDLGYGLRKEFWRQGITTEAAKAILERAKNDGLPYVTATHDVKNPGSGGVMKKLGMRYRYSYEEQWQPKNIPVVFRMYQANLDGQDDRVYLEYWNQSARHFVEQDMQ